MKLDGDRIDFHSGGFWREGVEISEGKARQAARDGVPGAVEALAAFKAAYGIEAGSTGKEPEKEFMVHGQLGGLGTEVFSKRYAAPTPEAAIEAAMRDKGVSFRAEGPTARVETPPLSTPGDEPPYPADLLNDMAVQIAMAAIDLAKVITVEPGTTLATDTRDLVMVLDRYTLEVGRENVPAPVAVAIDTLGPMTL